MPFFDFVCINDQKTLKIFWEVWKFSDHYNKTEFILGASSQIFVYFFFTLFSFENKSWEGGVIQNLSNYKNNNNDCAVHSLLVFIT